MSYRQYRPETFPPVVKNLLIINVLFYVAQLSLDNAFNLTDHFGLWPIQSPQFRPYQLFTHMFSHNPDDWAHIGFNLYSLWLFGKLLENRLGAKKFLIFYVVCGLGAAAAQMVVSYFQYEELLTYTRALDAQGYHREVMEIFETFKGYVIGASGAIMGLCAGMAYLFPNTELIMFPIPIPIRAKWLAIGYVAIDLYSGLRGSPADHTAHFAHLGGALTGFLLVLYWNKTNRKTFY